MAEEKKKMYELVAERIINQLENGSAPWQQPWNNAGTNFTLPYNAVTNNAYKGLNSLYLNLFSPFSDPRWATFKQADSQGWHVNKGSKGFMINYVKTHEQRTLLDPISGKPMKDAHGMPIQQSVKLQKPIITTAWVFNAEQITGIPPLTQKEEKEVDLWEKIARAESIIKASGAIITHSQGDAFYAPSTDRIQMPERTQFDASDKYYSVLLHELGHWTGHPERLNRGIMNTFGSPEYAREELRAEIGSMMLGSELKIGRDPKYQIDYVASWIALLKNTPQEILLAAADAQKINDYILAFEHKIDLKQERKLDTGENMAKKTTLVQGDTIRYKDVTFHVKETSKRNVVISLADTGQTIRLSPKDGLYASLLESKKNPSPEQGIKQEASFSQTRPPERQLQDENTALFTKLKR